jgi:16S rRNA (cytidine1402-2'-O)-methyltransferase
MDTPYRNQNLLDDLLATCNPQTNLCIALDIGGAEQYIKTKTIEQWKKTPPTLTKKPALFLI